MLTLIIGGARSGKSRFAQSLASEHSRVAYIATARPEDDEMAERIARHRSERPASWITVEEPLEIARAVDECAAECEFILLDCLTLWLSNMFAAERSACAMAEAAKLPMAAGKASLAVVTNEVGSGIVPESALGRAFRDAQGWLNQEVARVADRVYHVVAGIPVAIKGAQR